MSASAWRWALLAFCLLFMAQEAWTIPLTMHSVAVTGVSVSGRVAPFRWSIAVGAESPPFLYNSPAYRAGLRDGALVHPAQGLQRGNVFSRRARVEHMR